MHLPKHLLLLLIMLLTKVTFANTIDDLKTDHEVLNLLIKLDSNFIRQGQTYIDVLPTDSLINSLECKEIARAWKIKSWEKTDFNADHLTDLIVTAKSNGLTTIFVVIDKGNKNLKLIRLSRWIPDNCQMAKPIKIGNKQMLLFYSTSFGLDENKADQLKKQAQIDTLLYKYDDFVEFNPKPANYKIKSIYIETSRCFGSCPIFKLTVTETGNAIYDAGEYNPKVGNFKGTLSANKVSQLFSLVNYMDIKKLKNSYGVNGTDTQTAVTKIEFADGSVKTINDYFMAGSFGLSRLYSLLFDLRNTERWTETNSYKFSIPPPIKLSN